jgi:Protein kinase domain
MPPPRTIPTSHISRMMYPPHDITSSSSLVSEGKADISTSTRFSPSKHAGFKPMTQTSSNSALKKFFPGDDDDMELASDDQLMSSSSTGPVVEETAHESNSFFHMIARDSSRRGSSSRHSPFQMAERNIGQNGIPSSPQQDPSTSAVDTTAADDAQRLNSPGGSQDKPEPDNSEIPVTPSVGSPGELYRIISQVGEGTFGKVYKAQNTVTKLHVALKRIRMESEKDGFPVTAMREIKLLQSLRHSNVVQLYEMMVSNGESIVPSCKRISSLSL